MPRGSTPSVGSTVYYFGPEGGSLPLVISAIVDNAVDGTVTGPEGDFPVTALPNVAQAAAGMAYWQESSGQIGG